MSLSPKQTARYWREWAAVCRYLGFKNSDEVRRRALHAEAKCPASMKDFTNKDFDLFLDYCAILQDNVPAPRDPERERLLFAIERDAKKGGLNWHYIRGISENLFHSSHWRDLPLGELEKLRNVIHNRARRKESEAKESTLNPQRSTQPF